jgi:hypothetical protein
VQTPAALEKTLAPIAMSPRTVPVNKPQPARISTSQNAPAKFETTVQPAKVTNFQSGPANTDRVTTTKTKIEKKGSVFERIDRTVFRKNAPAPSVSIANSEMDPEAVASGTAASGSP